MIFKVIAAAVAVAGGAAGCGTSSSGTIGGGAGAGIGGVLGAQFGSGTGQVAATIGGALIGDQLGTAAGATFDEQDKQLHQAAAQQAFANPTGRQVPWTNPQSGNSGSVQANPPLLINTEVCSKYIQAVYTAGGQASVGEGCVCRGADAIYQDKQCPSGA